MRFIYADESGTTNGKYLVIGSLWGTSEQFAEFELLAQRTLDLHFTNRREIKWKKVSRHKLPGYLELLNIFMFKSGLEYRCLKLERARINHDLHNAGDNELGYYKFLFQLVSKNIAKDATYRNIHDLYLIYHDKVNRQIRQEARLSELKGVLNNALSGYALRGKSPIRDIQPMDSKASLAIQLTDVITGAVRSASDDVPCESQAKNDIISFLESGAKCSLSRPTPYLMEKVNIWDFRLR